MAKVACIALGTFLSFIVGADVGKADETSVSDKTNCRVAIDAFAEENLSAIRPIGIYIQKVMIDQERRTGTKAFSRQNEKGQSTTIALVVAFCRENPSHTIRRAAVDTYDGLRALGQALGAE